MSFALAQELGKKNPFDLPEEEALLNIVRTSAALSIAFEREFRQYDLTDASYNVLRILRGSGPSGKLCSQVGRELVAQGPDVTRLIDRLERKGLCERRRSTTDRRAIWVVITPSGLDLVNRLDEPVKALLKKALGHMSRKELELVSELLVKVRTPVCEQALAAAEASSSESPKVQPKANQ
ncbi:MAG: MarR family transcriptional regulator [Planctomycetes bacterium]|nr:MarR family transcriptional regulator [Planctomycetota bacterium]